MFDWQEYLKLAQQWATRLEEANQRSAVSRAYYAVFCSCRNWIREHQPGLGLSQKSSVHSEVVNAFLQSEDERKIKIGKRLKRLRKFRNKADYDDRSFPVSEVQRSLRDAETIFRLLQSPPKDPEDPTT